MAATRVQKKAETRARIISSAVDVFIDGSVVTTSMEVVAKAARVSKATLFFHFGSRIELLEAIGIELWRSGAHSTFRPSEPGLEAALRDYFAAQREPKARLLWEIGDVVSAAGSPAPDVAYRYLIAGIDVRLAEDGFEDAPTRARLARLLAPAALTVARRAAFGQADAREIRRFMADVDALVAHWRPAPEATR